jgi:hypothetical protein
MVSILQTTPAGGEAAMETIVVGATLAGSLGAAWVIQRAILVVCIKAINTTRRAN